MYQIETKINKQCDMIDALLDFHYREYEQAVRTVAKAFLKLGLERYHSVCILGFNCPEWMIADLATIYAG